MCDDIKWGRGSFAILENNAWLENTLQRFVYPMPPYLSVHAILVHTPFQCLNKKLIKEHNTSQWNVSYITLYGLTLVLRG